MSDIQQIWDFLSGKLRKVSNLRRASFDDAGEVVMFDVVTPHRTWPLALPYAMFKQTNPNARIKGG